MADILMRYRGDHKGSLEAALSSGPRAVVDYLEQEQFESQEKIDLALEMVGALAGVISDATEETAADYANESANPATLCRLADNVEGLRWISDVAGVAELRYSK